MGLLSNSLGKLAPQAAPVDFERIAVVLHDVMSARFRSYHTSQHLFDVCSRLKDPIEVLAALGHDLVYIQVDQRIHPKLAPFLKEFTLTPDMNVQQTPPPPSQEAWVPALTEIFGVSFGAIINPLAGGNEFLSAMAWCRQLSPWLKTDQLLGIAICIEGTIPFRPQGGPTDSPHIRLKNRLRSLLKDADPDAAIARAVRVANSDVHGFGYQPLHDFLDNTWLLILEGNPIFRNPVYTARQYREALGKIGGFFRNVRPETVFSHDGTSASLREYKKSVQGAARNLKLGALYVEAKILAVSFFEALSLLTGGEAPLMLFLGIPTRQQGRSTYPIEKALKWKRSSQPSRSDPVLKSLKQGRSEGGEGFDLSRSPVAAELCARLKSSEYEKLTQQQARFQKGEISPLEFLQSFPRSVRTPLLRASAQVAESRKQAILALAKTLSAT